VPERPEAAVKRVAKRIAEIHGLHHGKGSQRQTLVSYAVTQHCLPLYLVYTGSGAAKSVKAQCPKHVARSTSSTMRFSMKRATGSNSKSSKRSCVAPASLAVVNSGLEHEHV
jgi:hypothetical protein